jgi:transposase
VLTDRQWEALAPLVPGADATSRGRIADPRGVVEGILYAIRNGMGMQSAQPPYPSGSTLYRRFTAWTTGGQWNAIWAAFLETLSPSERRQWEAAAKRRPGSGADHVVDVSPPADTRAVERPRAAVNGYASHPNGKTEPPAVAPVHAAMAEVQLEQPVRPSDVAAPADLPAARAVEPPAPAMQMSSEAARQQITERLGLSAAESEIARRRIADHGVAAALTALDEVERRIATGTMRGVGGMPMSAFEIWVCAIGLARRPVERPRTPARAQRSLRRRPRPA